MKGPLLIGLLFCFCAGGVHAAARRRDELLLYAIALALFLAGVILSGTIFLAYTYTSKY